IPKVIGLRRTRSSFCPERVLKTLICGGVAELISLHLRAWVKADAVRSGSAGCARETIRLNRPMPRERSKPTTPSRPSAAALLQGQSTTAHPAAGALSPRPRCECFPRSWRHPGRQEADHERRRAFGQVVGVLSRKAAPRREAACGGPG